MSGSGNQEIDSLFGKSSCREVVRHDVAITCSYTIRKMMRIAIALLGTVLLVAMRSFAASIDDDSAVAKTATDVGSYRPGNTADHVHIVGVDRTSSGDKAVVTVTVDPGYHINANPASFEYLIPTRLNVTNQPPLRVRYPAPVRFRPKFVDEALDVYEGTVRITAEFAQGSTEPARLFGTVTAQACTDEICLPPADLPLPNK